MLYCLPDVMEEHKFPIDPNSFSINQALDTKVEDQGRNIIIFINLPMLLAPSILPGRTDIEYYLIHLNDEL